MGVKVSVIIPVYNCEKYLGECIESLIDQTLQECEFIFVNDGSKDKSEEIIKKYADKDERIILINQKNSGVSVARNVGIKKASGEYIGFVDGDDYIDKYYYEKLYNNAKENYIDIIFCNWRSNNNILELPFNKNEILNEEYIEEFIYKFLLQYDSLNSVCNKLFSRKLIHDNNISFPIGMYMGEDARFNIKAFTYTKSVYYLDYVGYYYREVAGSATRSIENKDYFKRILNEYKSTIDEFNRWNYTGKEIEKFRTIKFINNVMALSYVYLGNNKKMKLRQRYKYVSKMIKNKDVQYAIDKYSLDIIKNIGRYEQCLLKFIKLKFTLGVYILNLYSRIRNKDI